MKQIKRFPLVIEPSQKIMIPFNSEVLGVNHFEDKPCLIAIVDPGQKNLEHTILMISEDKDLDQRSNRTNYLGRFFHKGHAVHVFDNH